MRFDELTYGPYAGKTTFRVKPSNEEMSMTIYPLGKKDIKVVSKNLSENKQFWETQLQRIKGHNHNLLVSNQSYNMKQTKSMVPSSYYKK